MSRTVNCQMPKREALGLERPPYPGALGRRVCEHVAQEGWKTWLERLTTIINEYRLSTADPKTIEILEPHMRGFLFGEGDRGKTPPGSHAPARKK